MARTLFLMIKFIFKFDGQIEAMYVCNGATCIRPPKVKSQKLELHSNGPPECKKLDIF